MNQARQCRVVQWGLVAGLVAAQLGGLRALAQTSNFRSPPQPSASTQTDVTLPPLPRSQSPVELFRQLLAMSLPEQIQALSNRPPAIRARIFAKIREYQAMDPNARELRLRATELRWYLLPLLHAPATNRAAQLALIPEDMRELVRRRLMQWDLLPPPLQQEFLENERVLLYFSHVNVSNPPPLPGSVKGQPARNPDLAHWNSLSGVERARIAAQFHQFFELSSAEKQKALNTLSDAERRQMEQTLHKFDRLPPPQRARCVRAFTRFASLSPQEKQEFLKNARRWSKMSPKERQTWRDLIAHVPQWPPLPPGFLMPPKPPPLPSASHPAVATNLN